MDNMDFLPPMQLHSAIGLQLLALPSTFILCFTSMLRERSIGDRDEKSLVRLYKQHAFVFELVQLFVTFMACGFVVGNTMAAFEARSLVIDFASEEVTRTIVRSALVRNAWLLGSAVCILACVNMLDSWSLPDSMQDLTDPLFRLTRTLIGSYLWAHSTYDESQSFFCDKATVMADLERSSCSSKKAAITRVLADLPTEKPTSETSDSDETVTITSPQLLSKTNPNDAPRPSPNKTDNSNPLPPQALDSFPKPHPPKQTPTPSTSASTSASTSPSKPPPHYQDQTTSSSLRSSNSSLNGLSSSSPQQTPQQHPESTPETSRKPLKPSLSSQTSSSFSRKVPPRKPLTTTSKNTKLRFGRPKEKCARMRKRSVTFDLRPTAFPFLGLSGDGDVGSRELAILQDDDDQEKEAEDGDEKEKPNIGVQTDVVRERVRVLESSFMGASGDCSSGGFEFEEQQQQQQQQQRPQSVMRDSTSGIYDDDGDDAGRGDEREEEREATGAGEGAEDGEVMTGEEVEVESENKNEEDTRLEK